MNKILEQVGLSIFTEMSALSLEYNAVNLSQGFPNFEGPQDLKDVFIYELQNGWNQYIPSPGYLDCRESISTYYKKHYNLDFNPVTQITITNGATEGLYNSIQALINQGDEVIVFEPFYDAYLPMIRLSGGIPIGVRINLKTGSFSLEELQSKLTNKTKAILLNNPHNPSGIVFSDKLLEDLSKLAIKHDLFVFSDEVYEHLLYDGLKHKSIATYPGMLDRTIIISSMGKSFSFTGWKTGWSIANPAIAKLIRCHHQFTSFSGVPAAQKAAAFALKKPDSYFNELREFYTKKRDFLKNGLEEIGFKINPVQGSYFLMADYSDLSQQTPYEFAKTLVKEAKVSVIPPETFYLSKFDEKFVRFCFCKTDDVLIKALENLKKYYSK